MNSLSMQWTKSYIAFQSPPQLSIGLHYSNTFLLSHRISTRCHTIISDIATFNQTSMCLYFWRRGRYETARGGHWNVASIVSHHWTNCSWLFASFKQTKISFSFCMKRTTVHAIEFACISTVFKSSVCTHVCSLISYTCFLTNKVFGAVFISTQTNRSECFCVLVHEKG